VKAKLNIVKIGGALIDDEAALKEMLNAFSKLEGAKILIHGGGKLATELASRLEIKTQMINGRRITDSASLELITMVYGGLVSKNMVAKLQALNCNALGLSGADANCIKATIRPKEPIDFGYVGDVVKVNEQQISSFLRSNICPVFCAISHDQKGQLLNTNADTIAAEIAIAMSETFETSLYYCFEKKGVLTDVTKDESVIKHLNQAGYENLKAEKLIFEGMLPKLENCFYVLRHNVAKVYIGQYTMLANKNDLFTTITL